jgi:hypothetical protein
LAIGKEKNKNKTNPDLHCITQKVQEAGCQWLTPVILATQEAEIRRIAV